MASESALSRATDAWPEEVEVVGSTVIPPDPKIMEAIGLNYALETAVADLVDNSIDAGAANVLIRFVRRGPRLVSLCIVDDGHGMDENTLDQAMALGKRRKYNPRDLGHFGLGLKAASLGHSAGMTVISRSATSAANGRQWLIGDAKENFHCGILARSHAEEFLERSWAGVDLRTGTVVRWDGVRTFPKSGDPHTTEKYIEDTIPALRNHLGLTFHRLIENQGINIKIDVQEAETGNTGAIHPVLPIDPFGYHKSGSPHYPKTLKASISSDVVALHCHIWPPRSQAKEFRVPRTGQHQGQGFYFYRNDRLLQGGGWNGIYQPDAKYQLARICVEYDDIPMGELSINPEKTSITPSEEFVEAIESASTAGLKLHTFLEEAATCLRDSRRKPGAKPRVVPPGRGFAPAIRSGVRKEADLVDSAECIDIRWVNLDTDQFFKICLESNSIHLNKRYRLALTGDRGTSLNDAPLVKAAMYLLLQELFQGDYLGAKEKARVEFWTEIMTTAAKNESK